MSNIDKSEKKTCTNQPNQDIKTLIGAQIKKSRKKANLTQGQVVQKLKDQGEDTSERTLYLIENGKGNSSIDQYLIYLQFFGIKLFISPPGLSQKEIFDVHQEI